MDICGIGSTAYLSKRSGGIIEIGSMKYVLVPAREAVIAIKDMVVG